MDLSSLPQTALEVIWESLDDWEACQSLRCSCVTLRNVSDGLIKHLDMDFLRDCKGTINAFSRFPRKATLRRLCLISCNVDDNDEDTLGVPPSFKFAPLFDKIMGNGDLLARLAGVNDLSLSNCEVN